MYYIFVFSILRVRKPKLSGGNVLVMAFLMAKNENPVGARLGKIVELIGLNTQTTKRAGIRLGPRVF